MEAPEKVVTVLYRIFLGRDADELGLDQYSRRIAKGETPFVIAAELRSSDEFDCRLPKHLLVNKSFAEIYNGHGEFMLDSGNYEEAIVNFDMALAHDHKLAVAYRNRGRVYDLMDRPEDALVCFDLALALAPGLAEIHCLRSLLLSRMGRAKEALDAADRAESLDATSVESAIARARALARLGRPSDALETLSASIEKHPESAQLHLERGSMLEEMKRPAEAGDNFRRAAELAPSSSEPPRRLGLLAEAAGDSSAALSYFNRAVAFTPDCFDAWFRRGALLAQAFDLPARLGDTGVDFPPAPESMTYILYSETGEDNVHLQLGRPEYSYYFVREAYRKLLERRGKTLVVSEPERQVDQIYDRLRAQGDACVFLSFAPPHRSFVNIRCPTIPVFAWEFDTVPVENLNGGRLDDWRRALARFGCAIVHSRYARESVARAMFPGFPAISIPAPIWDRQQHSEKPSLWTRLARRAKGLAGAEGAEIKARQSLDCVASGGGRRPEVRLIPRRKPKAPLRFGPDEIVYATVFNPDDGRKNWHDLVRAFCIALAQESKATLVLKLVRHDNTVALNELKDILLRLPPFRCRVVAIGDFLDPEDYDALVDVADYAVNASFGEGQCLPLMEFMSRGKPAVAPDHTSMADYIDPTCAFVIASHREPCFWPHDTNFNMRAHRYRMVWDTAVQAFQASYRLLDADPKRYEDMAAKARENLRLFCSEAIVYDRLRRVVALKLALDAGCPQELKTAATESEGASVQVESVRSEG